MFAGKIDTIPEYVGLALDIKYELQDIGTRLQYVVTPLLLVATLTLIVIAGLTHSILNKIDDGVKRKT